jgi:hypothetical protein
MKTALVIYHDNCADGFTAAWAAWRQLGEDAEYLPANYGDPPPEVDGREVYILDFSYPRAVLMAMKQRATYLHVLDHHRTAAEDLKDLPFATFDMKRSGAGLAWSYFHQGEPGWLVQYVEDRDLWRFALPDSKEANAWIGVAPRTFTRWESLSEYGLEAAVSAGRAVLASIESYVREVAKGARRVFFAGRIVPTVNAAYPHTSELLHALAVGEPFAMSWFQLKDGRYKYSLRSEEGGADVAEIAKRYGGGGHTHAAGFERVEPLTFEGCDRTMVGGRCFDPSCPVHGAGAQP